MNTVPAQINVYTVRIVYSPVQATLF